MLKNNEVPSRRVARIRKRGGGLFLKSEKSANDLDLNFHCSCISITRFVRKLRRNFSEIQTFFQPKNRWSPKKKKKIFTKIETDFSAKIENSNAFSHRITTSTSQLQHPISFGGGCFQFFTKNRPQKHKKCAILHTSQANGEDSSLPPTPSLATLLVPSMVLYVVVNVESA